MTIETEEAAAIRKHFPRWFATIEKHKFISIFCETEQGEKAWKQLNDFFSWIFDGQSVEDEESGYYPEKLYEEDFGEVFVPARQIPANYNVFHFYPDSELSDNVSLLVYTNANNEILAWMLDVD